MSTLTKITVAFSLILLASIETTSPFAKGCTSNTKGKEVTKTVKTQPYDVVKVVGSMDVYLINGSEGSISVTADENTHKYIIVESDGNTLTISLKNNAALRKTGSIKIKVPFKKLSEVTLTGSGEVESEDVIKNSSLNINLKGSGEMDLVVEATSIDAKVNGSGEMELKGKVTDFEIKATGSGEFNGKSLLAENTQVYISGSGNAKVNAKQSLKARINGSGNIAYGGNPPANDSKVLGSGSISPF